MKKGRMAKSKHRQIKRVRALVSDPRDMIVHVRGEKKCKKINKSAHICQHTQMTRSNLAARPCAAMCGNVSVF